jgi:uncharacterized OsmC-like protein
MTEFTPPVGYPPPKLIGSTVGDRLIARGKADPAATRTLRCRTVAQGHFRQLNYIRDLPAQPVVEDEPEGLLAETTAPNATEALLAALGSCLSVGIHANAVARHLPIRALELEIEADINTTAGWGAGDLHPKTIGFETIRILVRIEADAPRDALLALVEHATLWSPVANTLHNPVHLDVTLRP